MKQVTKFVPLTAIKL